MNYLFDFNTTSCLSIFIANNKSILCFSRILKVYGAFFLRMKFNNISFMGGQVNGDLGVVYHKVTFCVIKCILESEYTLVIV